MEPYHVFAWSWSVRENICRSAEVGDTVLSMQALPMVPSPV